MSKNAEGFHKMNLTRSEYKEFFVCAGFEIDYIIPLEYLLILFKLKLFRAGRHKKFDENKRDLKAIGFHGLVSLHQIN